MAYLQDFGAAHWCQLNVKPKHIALYQVHSITNYALATPPRFCLATKSPLPVRGEGIKEWGKMTVE